MKAVFLLLILSLALQTAQSKRVCKKERKCTVVIVPICEWVERCWDDGKPTGQRDWFYLQIGEDYVLDVPSGLNEQQLIVAKKNGGNNQQWKMDADGRLYSRANGLFASITGNMNGEHAKVISWNKKEPNGQTWQLIDAGGNKFYIKSKLNNMKMGVNPVGNWWVVHMQSWVGYWSTWKKVYV